MEKIETYKSSVGKKQLADVRHHIKQRIQEHVFTENDTWGYPFKRTIDICVAVTLIVLLLSWLTPVMFLLIKIDSKGNFIFKQRRVGRHGKVFVCYKYRTLHPNDVADILQVGENDTRITRVGRVLRKLHIDELPQLINILLGDMSLVGPRPHMIADEEIFSSLVENYTARHSVRPGLTGLAQAKGFYGPASSFYDIYFRTKLDRLYIRKASFLLDLKIILSTLRIPFLK